MAKVQVPSKPLRRERAVNRTCYSANIERAMQKRIKEGSDVGAFFSEWHRLLGAVRAVSLVLECSDQAVRTWLYDGTAPSAATRAMMRIITPKMTKLPDKAWTTLKSWEIYQQMQAN